MLSKPQILRQVKMALKPVRKSAPTGSEDEILFEVKICIGGQRAEPSWTLTDCPPVSLEPQVEETWH